MTGMFTEAVRLPSAKFAAIGDQVTGVVTDMQNVPVPLFNDKGRPSGENKKNDDGTDATQVDVTLDTEFGPLVLHTDGGVFWAIGRALAAIKADDLEVGDILTIEYTGDAEPTAKGRNGAKQYTATVTKGDAPKSKQ